MRAVIQRVSKASVNISGTITSSIEQGILILLGIENADGSDDIDWLCKKIMHLRIFPDSDGVMNLSVNDVNGEIMIVSQFTLHASTRKGNRPSYIRAAQPSIAIPLYEQFIHTMQQHTMNKIKTGEFGAMMDISMINSGPVTIIIDSKTRE
jgi:D-aminoacyl-tRNA deacylase